MAYTVTTWPATVLSGTSAKLLADFSGDSTGFSFYFTYGTSSVSAKQTPLVSLSNFSDFTYTLTGLSVNTSYIFKAVAVKGATIVNGRSFNFTTFDEEPGSPGTDPVPIPDDPDPPGGGVIVRPAVTPTTPSTASAENVDWKVDSWWNNVTKGPWAFEKCPNKPRYNEGSVIADVNDLTWSMDDFSGDPITPGHDPCGYWPTEPYSPYVPFEFIEELSGNRGQSVSWGDITTTTGHGRFVKSFGTNVSYSDDDGSTWTNSLSTTNSGCLVDFANGFFFVSDKNSFHYSADGINWSVLSLATLDAGSYTYESVTAVSYNKDAELFVFCAKMESAFGSNWSGYFYGASDLSSFYSAYAFRLRSYATFYGCAYFNHASYIGSYNYEDLRWSGNLSTTVNDFVSLTQTAAMANTQKYQMASNETKVLVWSHWYTEDGTTWNYCYNADSKTNTGAFSEVDYHAVSKFISYRTLTIDGVSRQCIITSLDGKTWYAPYYYTASISLRDVAIGSHGYFAAGYYGSIIGRKQDVVPEVSERRLTSEGKLKWRSYKGQTPWTL